MIGRLARLARWIAGGLALALAARWSWSAVRAAIAGDVYTAGSRAVDREFGLRIAPLTRDEIDAARERERSTANGLRL